ncbi:transcriptional attenuator, LytR family [Asanoa ishikariensis]|uniref:Transcriptional attenuator, LytR family n=1 Tax=Asanoa ishikariensis TaxID=137265 RepID=A0A1H3M2D0_9ACTN|nr:LCP family protein [Asanoa ishikariensis]SDY70897.1 transcriptional attenuator, LytR family [Asanoa ishikariensis]
MTGTGNEAHKFWQRLRGRRPVLLVAAAVVAVLLIGGAVFAATRSDEATPKAAPSNAPTESAPAPAPSPTPTVQPGADMRGPLDLLLVGVDTRVSVKGWEPHADAVLILHVNADLESGYLFSLPRDLVVDIPAFPKAGYRGGTTKLTHAMSYGSRRGKGEPSAAQGFQLLSQTVSKYTGIKKFQAGAILNFGGFEKLINELGGVDLYVDQKVVSKHRQPNGKPRTLRGGDYVGPQATYNPGNRHFAGWQAIDYARQRYTAGGDYARQRHQQQLIKAILAKALSTGLPTDADAIQRLFKALGGSVDVIAGERTPVEYGFALSKLRPETLKLVSLPGGGVGSGGGYRGEQLTKEGRDFIKALRTGKADAYLKAHPKLVVKR